MTVPSLIVIDDRTALAMRGLVNQFDGGYAVKGVDLDIRLTLEHIAHDFHTLLHREERRFVDVHQDGDDDPVEQVCAPFDDIDVSVGQRIK